MTIPSSLSVTYGIHTFDLQLGGLAVAEVHSAVKDLTGAPDDVEAYLDGQVVLDPSMSTAGAGHLVFMKTAGRKGCGLWEEGRFLAFTGITPKRLEELCDLGLKLIEADGRRWLHEDEAAKWTRFLIEQAQQPTIQHSDSSPPEEFAFGPLVGSKSELATWLSGRSSRKGDALQSAAKRRIVWVKKHHSRLYEVWFRHESRFQIALRAKSEVPVLSRRKVEEQ